MLLRSSSTPVLGSLLPSHSESPGPVHHEATGKQHLNTAAAFGHNHHRTPFHATTFSCSSSPISPSAVDSTRKGFRRAQSEGNLEELVGSDSNEEDRFGEPHQARKFGAGRTRSGMTMLQTIPSFSFYGSGRRYDEDEEEEESEFDNCDDERDEFEDSELRYPRMALRVEGLSDIERQMRSLAFNDNGMFLSKGLGVGVDHGNGFGSCGGGGGGGRPCRVDYGGDGRENHGIEEYYKRMVEENPNNPLFLRNYAEFLHLSKGEVARAEEYYSRAILADPGDGELLSRYAKLVWELHRDKERSLSYFERATQASPEDSHVHAAYAGFLWETEDEGDGDEGLDDNNYAAKQLGARRQGIFASTGS